MPLRKFISREVGHKIKTIRLALKMSQEQFGKQAGNYSQDTVTKWEGGQVPHAPVLKRISEISDPPRSVDWILDGRLQLEGEQNPSKSPKNVENERIFGHIVFDALRQLIREEINAALKRAKSTPATKKPTR
jgi:transcriptional regulator with XRE-family HTH domain